MLDTIKVKKPYDNFQNQNTIIILIIVKLKTYYSLPYDHY